MAMPVVREFDDVLIMGDNSQALLNCNRVCCNRNSVSGDDSSSADAKLDSNASEHGTQGIYSSSSSLWLPFL